jgi:hypothetical protein
VTSRRQRKINRSTRGVELLRKVHEQRQIDGPRQDESMYVEFDDEGRIVNGPWRDGALWVLNRKCDTCVFRPGNLMKLHPDRVDQMVEDCIVNNTVIPCHETLDGPRSICRGLFDVHYDDIGILQVADRLGILKYDDPPQE